MTRALLFPGQGSQKPGMGRELAQNFKIAKESFDEAGEALGFDVAALCFEGSADDLALTANAQPAILATSVAAWRVLTSETGFEADVAAGHSLGEYSALVCAGALKFSDALRLVRLRGRAMQDAVPVGMGSMAALIGLDEEQVAELCQAVAGEGAVSPANFNGGGQIVVSGAMAGVDALIVKAKPAGAKRAIKLKVSAPFHSPLMKPAADAMAAALADVSMGDMTYPVVANVNAKANQDSARVAELLISQVTGAVRWEASIQGMAQSGVTSAIECGHGAVLRNLCKRIEPSFEVKSMGVPDDLKSL